MADKEIEFVKKTKKCRFSDLPDEYFFRYKGRLFGKVEQGEDGCNAILANSAAFKDFSRFCFDDDTEVDRLLMCLKLNFIDGSEFKSGNLNVDRNNGSQIPRGCACTFDYLGCSDVELE